MRDLMQVLCADDWFAATEAQREEALTEVVAALGKEFEPVGVEQFGENPIGRVRHVGSGIVFSLVPGGTFLMGLSDEELTRFEEKADGADDGDEARHRVGDGGRMRPPHEVDVAPFLLAGPLPTAEQLERLTDDTWKFSLDCCIEPETLPDRVEAIASRRMRLPTEAEWEFAVRAGTRLLFPHGDDVPDGPAVPANGFGIEWATEFPEICADGWHADYHAAPANALPWAGEGHVFRGGAATVYPWQGCGEWTMMLCADRSPAETHEYFWAIRPAISLFESEVAYGAAAVARRAEAGIVVRPAFGSEVADQDEVETTAPLAFPSFQAAATAFRDDPELPSQDVLIALGEHGMALIEIHFLEGTGDVGALAPEQRDALLLVCSIPTPARGMLRAAGLPHGGLWHARRVLGLDPPSALDRLYVGRLDELEAVESGGDEADVVVRHVMSSLVDGDRLEAFEDLARRGIIAEAEFLLPALDAAGDRAGDWAESAVARGDFNLCGENTFSLVVLLALHRAGRQLPTSGLVVWRGHAANRHGDYSTEVEAALHEAWDAAGL